MVQLRVQRGLLTAALSLISRSTFSFMRLCRWASPLEPARQRVSCRISARELRCQRERFSGLFHHRREAWHSNHLPGPEIDLLFGRHRGGIRDDRLHDCLLLVSKCVSHSCDNFRHSMLDLGGRPSRSRVEVAGGAGLKNTVLPANPAPGRVVLLPRFNAWSKRRRPATCANAGFAKISAKIRDRLN